MNLLNSGESVYEFLKEVTDAIDAAWTPLETKILDPYYASASYSFTTDFGFNLHLDNNISYKPPLNLKISDLTLPDGRCFIENNVNNTFNLSGTFLIRYQLRSEGSNVNYHELYISCENSRWVGSQPNATVVNLNSNVDLPSGYILNSTDSIRTVLPNELGLDDLTLTIYTETVANGGSGGDLILDIEIQEVL